jgi:hypothetical protein
VQIRTQGGFSTAETPRSQSENLRKAFLGADASSEEGFSGDLGVSAVMQVFP